MNLIETDDLGGVILSGHSKRRFLVQENSDGSLLLLPAIVMSEAQYEYDTNPDLRQLLQKASASKTTSRRRRRWN